MSEPSVRRAPGLSTGLGSGALGRQPDSLADVLERVLDKGIVIVGDVVVNLLDIELLTLKLRLFVSSAETAREMGLDWWTRDPFFSGRGDGSSQNGSVENGSGDDEVRALHDRIAVLEDELRRQGRELPSAARQEEGDHGAR